MISVFFFLRTNSKGSSPVYTHLPPASDERPFGSRVTAIILLDEGRISQQVLQVTTAVLT